MATIERARIEAHSRARQIELEQERRHALELTKLAEQQRTHRYRVLALLSAGLSLLEAGAATCAYFAVLRPAQARERARYETMLERERERATLATRALELERTNAARLAARLGAPAEPRSDSTQDVAARKPLPAQPPRAARAAELQRGPEAPTRSPCRDAGDPLDGSPRPCSR